MTSRCSSCQAPIVWAITDSGRRMPVDAQPHEDGTVVLTYETSFVAARVDPTYTGPKHLSHFATCPNAGQHRRRTPTKGNR